MNKIVESDYGPIIINERDTYIGASIVRYGFWMQEEVAAIIARVERLSNKPAPITFYDVGANIGTHSLAVAKTLGDRVRIRAFEAQQTVFQMLCGTMALNNLRNVSCHHNAVSALSGLTLTFNTPDYTQANNFGALELHPPTHSDNAAMKFGGTESVRTMSIDSFDEPVDFIKLDVEGMEVEALCGAARTIAKHRPIVFAETTKCDREKLAAIFDAHRYRADWHSAHVWAESA